MKPSRSRTAAAMAAGVLAVTALCAAGPGTANADVTTPLAAPVWLCRPGMPDNPCNQDAAGNPVRPAGIAEYPSGATVPLDSTTVSGGIAVGVEPFVPRPDPPVDCFYVYPTVDLLSNPVVGLGANPPEARPPEVAVTLAQVGRLTSQCRVFALLYRQATLAQLLIDSVVGVSAYTGPGFQDVQQAWDHYWTHDNVDPVTGRRRGVVLLGHSQGSVAVENLIRTSIDGNPTATSQLVSAVLLGGVVQVPTGGYDGGGTDPSSTFQHIPLCHAGTGVPVGCVIAYSSYNQTNGTVPGSGTLARTAVPGHQIACVNPATLLAGQAPGAVTPLDPYLPTRTLVEGNALNPNGDLALVLGGYSLSTYPTGFARYPGDLSGQCRLVQDAGGTASWLQVTGGQGILAAPSGNSAFGLHVVDYNLALGDLQRVLAAQTSAWLAAR